jgi:hypothetical protein
MTWHFESRRHGLASKGIRTSDISPTYHYMANGKPALKVGLPSYTREQLKSLNDLAAGKEWIAELIAIKGVIFIDDVQISDTVDKSWLRWDKGDEKRDIGYIHFHPPGIIPEFSAQDFVLAMNVHNLRTNRKDYPYTIMGLVYPKDNELMIVLYGINASKSRMKEFEGKEMVESQLKNIIDDMVKNKELLKLKETKL